jgi:hypothetical protein
MRLRSVLWFCMSMNCCGSDVDGSNRGWNILVSTDGISVAERVPYCKTAVYEVKQDFCEENVQFSQRHGYS